VKKIFVLILLSFNCMAQDTSFNPDVLAKEQPSEYTQYLNNLFKSYPELPIKKVSHKPILKKGSTHYSYRTEIKNQSDLKAANFSGNWILTAIPQGTGAFKYFLINVRTGKITDPHLMTTNGRPLFLPNRSLLVIAGSVGEKTLEDAVRGIYGGPKAFEWKKENLVPVEL
jgi:hypothetical protein